MSKEKDYMKNNPALSFISDAEPAATTPAEPEAVKRPETKSKRVQILVQPSTFAALERIASAKGISRNEAINEALKLFIEKEG